MAYHDPNACQAHIASLARRREELREQVLKLQKQNTALRTKLREIYKRNAYA